MDRIAIAFVLALMALWRPAAARAGDVVVVLTSDAAPYKQAEDGIRAKLPPDAVVRDFLLDAVNEKGLDSTIGPSPQAVVAIGTRAAAVLHTRLPSGVPLVFCMVASPAQAGLLQGRHDCGVSIDVPIAWQFALIAQADPKARTVGMLYRSTVPDAKDQLNRITQALPEGWKLEAVAVEDYGSIAGAIDALTSRHIDVIWTDLDSGIYETATVRTLLLAGLRSNVPVFGFSPAFVRAGALVGVGVDPTAQGQQAAELAARVLKNPADASIPRLQPPAQYQIAVNLIVADRLGLQVPSDLVEHATYVFRNGN